TAGVSEVIGRGLGRLVPSGISIVFFSGATAQRQRRLTGLRAGQKFSRAIRFRHVAGACAGPGAVRFRYAQGERSE
ncbi:MAG: hypothetical protein WBE92_14910, partial [Steroidobacteraceae bacterium]